MRFLLAALVAFLAAWMPTASAQAQHWPDRPIRIVVSFPPGGVADLLARLISAPLQEALGQPVVVENKAGAGGNIGGSIVAKSSPDGYTLLMGSGGMVSINPHLYAKMPFDPAKDIVPVAAVARVPFYLVVNAESGVRDFKSLVDKLKDSGSRWSFGSPGNGSSPHLAAEMMLDMIGAPSVHVPYRGGAPALTGLIGGEVQFLFDPGISIPYVQSGKLRMLAVASPQRSPLLPDTPTLEELGLKGLDADAVFGLYAPAGTPQEIILRLNAEVRKALSMPSIRDGILKMGNVPVPMTPEQFGKKGADDLKRFGAVIRSRGIKIE